MLAEEADIEEEALMDAAEEDATDEVEQQMASEDTTGTFVEIPVTETYSSHNGKSLLNYMLGHQRRVIGFKYMVDASLNLQLLVKTFVKHLLQ